MDAVSPRCQKDYKLKEFKLDFPEALIPSGKKKDLPREERKMCTSPTLAYQGQQPQDPWLMSTMIQWNTSHFSQTVKLQALPT